VLCYQNIIARLDSRLELARELQERALDLARQLESSDLVLQARLVGARLLVAEGRFADGARELGDILASPGLVDNPFITAECLGNLVLAAEGLYCWDRVARFHAAAVHLDSLTGRHVFKDDQVERARANERSLGKLGAARHALATKQGHEASLQGLIADVQAWVAGLISKPAEPDVATTCS
jgi:hypothetical protein